MDVTAWAMAAHIITLGLWSASLLILAGLYGAAPSVKERSQVYRHRLMCRYIYIMLGSPAAVLAIISGSALVALLGVEGSWLLGKLAVVSLLALFHAYCGTLLHKHDEGALPTPTTLRSSLMFMIPLVLISTILVLVLAKPDVVFEYQLAPQPAGHRNESRAQEGQIQTTAVDGLQRIIQTG